MACRVIMKYIGAVAITTAANIPARLEKSRATIR